MAFPASHVLDYRRAKRKSNSVGWCNPSCDHPKDDVYRRNLGNFQRKMIVVSMEILWLIKSNFFFLISLSLLSFPHLSGDFPPKSHKFWRHVPSSEVESASMRSASAKRAGTVAPVTSSDAPATALATATASTVPGCDSGSRDGIYNQQYWYTLTTIIYIYTHMAWRLFWALFFA